MHKEDSLEKTMAEGRKVEKEGTMGELAYIWVLA